VIYNIGGQYAGSPYHAPGFNSPSATFAITCSIFPKTIRSWAKPTFTLQWPGNGGGDNTYQREQTAYWIANEIGLPYCYRRHINLFINGARRAEMFEDAQQPNGDMTDEFYPEGADGDLHKYSSGSNSIDAAVSFTPNGASLGNFTTTGGQKKLARYRWTFAKRRRPGFGQQFHQSLRAGGCGQFLRFGRKLSPPTGVGGGRGQLAWDLRHRAPRRQQRQLCLRRRAEHVFLQTGGRYLEDDDLGHRLRL